jgi:hypothetical protein
MLRGFGMRWIDSRACGIGSGVRGKEGVMRAGNVLSRLALRFPAGVVDLLFSRRVRQGVEGLVVLRRVYEYVFVMAALEGAREVRRPCYEGYVDALEILGARALLIAKSL